MPKWRVVGQLVSSRNLASLPISQLQDVTRLEVVVQDALSFGFLVQGEVAEDRVD